MRHEPESLLSALPLLRHPDSVPIGAGVDLLETIREGLAAPGALVDVRAIEETHGIRPLPDGGMRVGASVTLAELAANAAVRERYPLLASASAQAGPVASLGGTLGGNLCQRPRCSYFRANVPCHKTGGTDCPAREGHNRHLAILEGGPCYIVHPSDLGAALMALDAVLEIAGPAGARRLVIGEFFVLPRERLDREHVLAGDELVVAVRLPAESAGGRQLYAKVAPEDPMQFTVVSIAAARRADGEVRLVLGGVAPRPYRVYNSIEEETMTGNLDEDSIEGLADRALLDAQPLHENGYKLDVAARLLRDAIRQLSAD